MDLKNSLKENIYRLKINIKALYLAGKRPDLPLYTRVFIAIVIGYALSPIDLIPDFIPVLGYVDDIILIPLGIWLALKLVPEDIMRECRYEAGQTLAGKELTNRTAGKVILFIWLLIMISISDRAVFYFSVT